MSAPSRERRSPGPQSRATPTSPDAEHDPTAPPADFDYDRRVVAQVDWSIWRALHRGEFRLAVRCNICGRWLTAGRSKKAHMGSVCASKAGKK